MAGKFQSAAVSAAIDAALKARLVGRDMTFVMPVARIHDLNWSTGANSRRSCSPGKLGCRVKILSSPKTPHDFKTSPSQHDHEENRAVLRWM